MADLLILARERYDAIVIDAPPLLYTAEASLLAQLADGLILVARLELLTRHQAERARKVLETMHLAPLGVIATGQKAPESGYGAGYEYRQLPREDSSGARSPAAAAPRRA
jgi:Mrp family chromosome partitioning ATPase